MQLSCPHSGWIIQYCHRTLKSWGKERHAGVHRRGHARAAGKERANGSDWSAAACASRVDTLSPPPPSLLPANEADERAPSNAEPANTDKMRCWRVSESDSDRNYYRQEAGVGWGPATPAMPAGTGRHHRPGLGNTGRHCRADDRTYSCSSAIVSNAGTGSPI